jgi:hypothetical protein
MINFILMQTSQRIGDPSLGIILPGVILLLSFVLTLLLIRYIDRSQNK